MIGVGVVGTVYGAQLASAGHHVSVLSHGRRTDEVRRDGLACHHVNEATPQRCAVTVVADVAGAYDLVLVAVRADQIRTAMEPLWLESCADPAISAFETALSHRGFEVTRTADMEGWLIYHAVFVASISAALYRHAVDPVALADDHALVMLMCRAIEEGFRALRRNGVEGAPLNLRVLHHRVLRPFAARYWSRTMRSPTGERIFAAHARHAETEMLTLAILVMDRLHDAPDIDALRRLLNLKPL